MSKASSIVKTVLGLIIGLAFVGAGVFALLYVLNEEPAAPSKPSGQVEPEPEVDVLEPKSFPEYTWTELGLIADLIEAAPDEASGRAIAQEYGLVDADGRLATSTHLIVIEGGMTVEARLVGILHDTRADGQGRAALTFQVFPIAVRRFNPTASSAGGWKDSELRAWLAQDCMALLPPELSERIVPVRKSTDNTGKTSVRTTVTVRRTLAVYLTLTAVFIILLAVSGMQIWDAVNLTFTNISSGGFSVNSDSIASLSHTQQYLLAAAMLLSGVNFTLLFMLFTFRWRLVRNKMDQLRFYLIICLLASAFVVLALHYHTGYGWNDALRLGTVQTVSALTTTGSVIGDYTQWWTPAVFLLLMLGICGGMAGSTSGGLKVMRVLILWRNARGILRNRLHPNAVDPVKLNGRPVSGHITNNVMVIFMVFGATLMLGVMVLMLCGVSPTEAIGASVGCLTGYGPGLGASGGFGSYAAFSHPAMWVCTLLMILGRLECMTVIILFLPRFWRK